MIYILVFIIIILLYIVFNLYRKELKYETIVVDFQNRQQLDYAFIDSINDVMLVLKSKLNANKLKTAFESDDEIGFYFNRIHEIHDEVLVYLQEYNTLHISDGEVDEKEKK